MTSFFFEFNTAHNQFIDFLNEVRPQIMKEHPNWKPYEVSKEAGKRWKSLSIKNKMEDKLEDKMEDKLEDKIEDNSKLTDSFVNSTELSFGDSLQDLDKNEENITQTPFTNFLAQVRPSIMQEHPNWTKFEVSKEAGRRWRLLKKEKSSEPKSLEIRSAMPIEKTSSRNELFMTSKSANTLKKNTVDLSPKKENNPYMEFYANERQKIYKEHPNWKQNQVSEEVSRRWKLKHQRKDSSASVEQKQTNGTSSNPFMKYLAEIKPKIMAEHPEWPAFEVSKEAGRRWKALSDAEKEAFLS